jgi:hypothetical protein
MCETMQKEAKKFVGFAKTSRNEAKQDAFRFISGILKKSEKGTPYYRPDVSYSVWFWIRQYSINQRSGMFGPVPESLDI